MRDLDELASEDATAVLDAIKAFAEKAIGDVKKLRGYNPPTWRLRCGRFRVLYRRQGETLIIDTIGDRRDVYR